MADNMKVRKTQNDKLLKYLQTGKTITSLQGLAKIGSSYLPARINDLKNMGYKIHSKYVEVTNRFGQKVRVKKYWLDCY